MTRAVDELWTVALSAPHVDADALAAAIEAAVEDQAQMDYRTRLLVRDGLSALESHWGRERFAIWLQRSTRRQEIENTRLIARSQSSSDDDARGFPTLTRRIVDAVKPEVVLQFFRELSLHVRSPNRLLVGGSVALILGGYLSRRTDDVDVVDEVPAELRRQHDVLDDLAARFGLRLSHFQSHYLPDGWQRRVHSMGVFGELHVWTIDVYDVFVGKLFSARNKDRDDLRAVLPKLDQNALVRRVIDSTKGLRSDPRLHQAAEKNWFVLFGDPLPA